MRPTTTGELLDSAVVLLRRCALPVLVLALAAAAAEQVLLWSVGRPVVNDNPIVWLVTMIGHHYLLLALGFGIEAFIVAQLGAFTARSALPAMLGPGVAAARPWRAARELGLSGLLAAVHSAGALLFVLGILYPLFSTGPAMPALVIDRTGVWRAFWRANRLSWSAFSIGMTRLTTYLVWLAIRVAFASGLLVGLQLVLDVHNRAAVVIVTMLGWAVANAATYAMLACVDAVLYLEARIRSEGLDIALGRALARGESVEPILAAKR
jgi:hypothetical protein